MVALSCHSDFFADFQQVWDHYNSYFCLLSLNIDLFRGGNLYAETALSRFFGLLITDFEQLFI